ncbi:MAG: M48 family metallopeptidase [Desulfovibrionaceae bacterium]|jgi:STE24 endopeptidase|nr:M48 family metallopeptidase [Desulfovibrionaceae bacterium]
MNAYLVIILASLALSWALDTLCAALTVRSLSPELPAEFRAVWDPAAYRRSQDYARDVARFSILSGTIATILTMAFLLAGGFNWVDTLARAAGFGELVTGLLFVGLLALLADLASTPFAAYRTFAIEARYGFNRTTPGLFVADKLKGWLLGACIAGPILLGVTAFFKHGGPWAWAWAWALASAVLLAVQYLAPSLILPLFNRFTPLPEGELRGAIEEYARTAGITLSGIFAIDGSRRSTKSNAYFTGFGKRRRIALFDTLIERQGTAEIVAVLAHEVGHATLGHVRTNTALAVAKLGLMLWLMSFFLHEPSLFEAFSLRHASVYAGLVFFMILYTPLSMLFGVAMSVLSRRFEYQADAFAARTTGRPGDLASALLNLSRDNLSNLTPHPAVVFLTYSHPPVLARIRALRGAA